MAYKDYLERLKKRNENLIAYAKEHPGTSQRAIAKIFKVSQARVSKILRNELRAKSKGVADES